MISLLLGGGILSSGSVLCCAMLKRKYEEVLPISFTAVVLILFLSGLAGNLPLGVAVTIGLAIAIYIIAIVWLIRYKTWKDFINNLCTPGFVLFVLFFIANIFFHYGRLAYHWDEFSHWALVTKAMTVTDDFGTNPVVDVPYRAYPPGMALLQYFFYKLGEWVNGASFVEWKLSFVWCIYLISFVVPFAGWFEKKEWKKILLCAGILIMAPLAYYNTLYYELYIDPFLGVVAGCGLATLWFTEEKDAFYYARLGATCATLTLAKDAGLGLALFLCLFCAMDVAFVSKKVKFLRQWVIVLTVFASAVIPKLLWSAHLKKNDSVLGKNSASLSGEFVGQFCRALYQNGLKVGNTGIMINYITLSMLLFFVIAGLCFVGRTITRKDKIMLLALCIQHIGYIAGLAATLLISLGGKITSFERYMNIEFVAVWIFLLLMTINKTRHLEERKGYLLCVGCISVVLMFSPLDGFINYVTRNAVSNSIITRTPFMELGELIQAYTPEDAKIHVISQGTNGFNYLVVNFNAVPRKTCGFWSLSTSETDDIYTHQLKPDDWMDYLIEHGYGYVALYKIDEAFREEYACLFDEGSVIEENSLYSVDAENRVLIQIAASEQAN